MTTYLIEKSINVDKERRKKLYKALNDRLSDKEEYCCSTTGKSFENSTETRCM